MTQTQMRTVRLEKVVVNIGLGTQTDRLDKAATVVERVTGQRPTRTQARASHREFQIRRGQDMGIKVTLRDEAAQRFLVKAFDAVGKKVYDDSFDDVGNLSFGIREHTDFEGERYDPAVGLFGMDIAVVLARAGRRVSRRRLLPGHIHAWHHVTKDEAVAFLKGTFGIEVVA